MINVRILAIGVALVALGVAGGYWLAMPRINNGGGQPVNGATVLGQKIDPRTGRPVLYWHDPMVPGQKFDKPGKSPFMEMELVPVYADEAADDGKVTINPRLQQNLGVRTVEVTEQRITPKVEAVGSVAFNERAVAQVTARATGFVEKLYVRAPLDPVHAGQPLAEILAPEWVAAQEEYLAIRRMEVPGGEALREAAHQRLKVLGMPEDVIRRIEREGKANPRVMLRAPIGGVIGELSTREGQTAMMGSPLFRINGLDSVWVNAEVPEAQAAWVTPGHPVQARVPAYPGEVFKGRIEAVLPEVNPATRTLRARIELANPKGLLKPGMFATVDLAGAEGKAVLTVPTEALIRTGKRAVVIVALPEGKFQPVDVEPGMEMDGMTEIRKGVERGQKIVISSQFLIDSEASLKATTTRFGEMPADVSDRHRGEGKVEAIDKGNVTLSHEPIPSMNWGAMTMPFKVPQANLLSDLKVGDRVAFEFHKNKQGEFEIDSMTRTPGAKR